MNSCCLEKLKVFVSSRTKELHDERVTIREALKGVNIETFIFEDSAGAKSSSFKSGHANGLPQTR